MHTDLDRPPTRFLDHLEVDRLRLLTTSVREVGPGVVVLDVACASDTTATRLAEGVELAGSPVEGGSLTVRVDAVGHHGPCWIDTHSPIEHFPLYQRAASLVPLAPLMAHVGERPIDVLTLRVGDPVAVADWRGVARVDGAAVTISTSRAERDVVVEGLPAAVEVRIVDRHGDVVDRPIRRN